MSPHNDHEHADLQPLPPERVAWHGNDRKSRLPPPSDKLVFSSAVQSHAPREPLLNDDHASAARGEQDTLTAARRDLNRPKTLRSVIIEPDDDQCG
ncbi:hypothetical protein E1286_01640 [Nonomuraea terrae]|uniref:Uncharacterized protein n=1 Tax=Nonomuraea terrae TaxID=2530383 RepID=A0A4R4ZG43_9ACTN|nr:hypothetical protein [Nonomuraea terrae]TDD57016.1 hypothetical protein E1286_01640 [Nonomuraea terrae]